MFRCFLTHFIFSSIYLLPRNFTLSSRSLPKFDSNYCVYWIEYATTKGENSNSWKWFVSLLKLDLGMVSFYLQNKTKVRKWGWIKYKMSRKKRSWKWGKMSQKYILKKYLRTYKWKKNCKSSKGGRRWK